jgi:hypothetical protein
MKILLSIFYVLGILFLFIASIGLINNFNPEIINNIINNNLDTLIASFIFGLITFIFVNVYLVKILKKEIIDTFIFDNGDPIQLQDKIDLIEQELLDTKQELAKKTVDDMSGEIEINSVRLLDAINTSSNSIDKFQDSILELRDIPKSVNSNLEKLVKGISGLLDQVDSQPEKVKEILNGNSENDKIIQIGIALGKLEYASEYGDISTFESSGIKFVSKLKNQFGMTDEKFLISLWLLGHILHESGEDISDNGSYLFQAVEIVMPELKIQN